MWTTENRPRYNRDRLRYPSDLTDEEWALVEPLIPPAKRGGRRRTVVVRQVVNGAMFAQAVAEHLPKLAVEIVKRSDKAKGFEVLPMRWVVERALAWLNRCRRLAKDFENLTDNALAFLRLASIRLMLRRLYNPA